MATCMRPEEAVGRPVRIFWPDEDAWFCGEVTSFDAASGQHQVLPHDKQDFTRISPGASSGQDSRYRHTNAMGPSWLLRQVSYADGDKESLWLASGVERVRMLLSAAEALVGPSPQQLHDLSQTLLSQSRSLRQGPHGSSGTAHDHLYALLPRIECGP